MKYLVKTSLFLAAIVSFSASASDATKPGSSVDVWNKMVMEYGGKPRPIKPWQ